MSQQRVSPAQQSAVPHFDFNRTFVAVHMTLLLGLGGTAMGVTAAQTEEVEKPRHGQPTGSLELSETMVEGSRDAPSASPPVYAGGQVASGGRVGLLGNKDFMETPFSTISYTEKYIEDTQAQTITDVIAATDPSVFSNGLKGTYSENYSIRGLNSNISDVSIGGLYGMAPYYRISPEMYERVEVLKGPSALLNGMPPGGSVAGSINLVPKRAGAEQLTRITGTYMSDAQFGGHLDVGRRFGEEQQFGVRFNSVYRDGDTATDHQRMKAELNALGLDWRGERARLSADLYESEDRVRGQNRGIGLAEGVPVPRPPKSDTLLNPDWGFVQTRDKGVIVRGEYDLNDNLMAYAAAGTSKTDYKYSGTMLAEVLNTAGDFETRMGQLKIDLEKTSGEAGLRGHFDTFGVGHQWSLNATHYSDKQRDYGRRNVPGAEWITNIYHPVWGPEAARSYPAIAHTESRLSSYGLADTLSFLDERLQLTLGVRRQQVLTDTFSVTTGAQTNRYNESATTPAAAVLVKVTDEVSLYANYIEGLSKGAVAPLTAPNAGQVFAPYKSKQKEVGIKLDLGDFAHTLSLYQIERPSSFTNPVTKVFSFGGEQRNRGLEWSFFGTPVADVRLMGGVARLDPKVTKAENPAEQGKTATGQPKLQGKLGVEWDTPVLEGLTLTANATAVSKQYISDDNSQSIPGYTLYDVGARYRLQVADHPVTLRGTVENVTNKAYWGMPLLTSLGLGAPRTVQLSASIDF
ncbi:iron complex outermembrane receptor protein [Pseudomonas sp. TE6288]